MNKNSATNGAVCHPAVMTVGGVRGVGPILQTRQEAEEFVWDVGQGPATNFKALGALLASGGFGLFRNQKSGLGLIRVLAGGVTRQIAKAGDLAPVLVDTVRIKVKKGDKIVGDFPPAATLNAMLRSERFLSAFSPVASITATPVYLEDFSLVRPGYNPADQLLYLGPEPRIADSMTTVTAFLNVMGFEGNADRTNTVAAALTVLLRHRWPGGKPLVLVTATKSHAGKGTLTDFIRGQAGKADILYENTDWPMLYQFQRQTDLDPDLGFVSFDNVRLDSAGGHGRFIRSAFVESFVTTGEVTLASPAAGEPVRLKNTFVVAFNTNEGTLSPDLLNRALPIHLAPKGDLHERDCPIGNPKYEFLPKNQEQIEAELRGMIERWKAAGRPLDEKAKHPMTPWAKVVGGILKVNGFEDFLGNYGTRRATADPIREAIAIMAAVRHGEDLRPKEWANVAVSQGLAKTLFTASDRDTPAGQERGIGVILKRHLGETFVATTETKVLRVRLDGGNRRWTPGENPHVAYLFKVLSEEPLPVEDEAAP
jgi:hypothetical protein